MSAADLATLEAAYDECRQGAAALLMQTPAGVLYWVVWLDARIEPSALGDGQYDVSAVFEQAL
jgi:hypothetical protein